MPRLALDLDWTLIYYGNEHVVKEMEDTYPALKSLSDSGFTFILITARDESERKTVEGIIHIISSIVECEFEQIIMTDGKPKGVFARQSGCIALVDDCKRYLSDCVEHGVIPIHFTSWTDAHPKILSLLTADPNERMDRFCQFTISYY